MCFKNRALKMTVYVLIGNFVPWNTWPFGGRGGVSGAENNKIFF